MSMNCWIEELKFIHVYVYAGKKNVLRADKKPENPAEDTVTSLTETKENKPANNKVTRLSSAYASPKQEAHIFW